MILERQGYRVDVASDGAEAVNRIRSIDYDAIVLDLMMPHLDGFALMDQLACEDPEKLRKVIVTSAASPALIRERMRGVPFALLPKPFDIVDLVERVRACVAPQSSSAAVSPHPERSVPKTEAPSE